LNERTENTLRPSITVASTFTEVDRSCELEQDLCGGLELAACNDQLDGAVQIGLGVREFLCQPQRISRLDQHMQAPGLDLLALGLAVFDRLGHALTAFSRARLFAFL